MNPKLLAREVYVPVTSHIVYARIRRYLTWAYKFNLQRDRLLRQALLHSGSRVRWSLAIGVSSQLDRKVFLERYSHTFLGAVYK